MKAYLLILVIGICSTSIRAQLFFKGEIVPNATEHFIKKISIMKPIGIYAQPWYSDSSDDLHFNNKGVLDQTMEFSSSNLIFFNLPNGQLFIVIAEPGDTVKFQLTADSTKAFRLRFLGKDSMANNYVNRLHQTILSGVLKLQQEQFEGPMLVSRLDSFIKAEKALISRNALSVFKADLLGKMIEARALYNIINLYGHTKNNSTKKEENDFICRELYKRFNPLQEKYIPTWTGLMNIQSLAGGTFEGRFQYKANQFQQIDSVWDTINEGYKIPSTFPEPFREGQLGIFILIDAIRLKTSYTAKAMSYFARQYPQSPFLPVFLKILASDNDQMLSKGLPVDEQNVSETSELVFVREPKTMLDLLNNYAKNKPVLIDCWATWCAPCVIEFTYLPQHEAFFKQNDIVKLYVSYDSQANASIWENTARTRKVKGVHIIANKSIEGEIADLIKFPRNKIMPIPRYVLLNSKHEVVNPDMIRPSDPEFEEQLLKQIALIKSQH